MVILVFFLVIPVNRRLFRYFGSYSGISVIPVILVDRRTGCTMVDNRTRPDHRLFIRFYKNNLISVSEIREQKSDAN